MNARTVTTGMMAVLVAFAIGSCAWRGGETRRLPRSATPSVPAGARDIRIALLADGTASVMGTEVPLKSLQAYLASIAAKVGVVGIRVTLSATEDTPYGLVLQVIAAARGAGFNDVLLEPKAVVAPASP